MATLNLASLYVIRGEMVNAVRWARQALRLNPKDRWTQEKLASMYATLGMHDEAIELLESSLRLHPDFTAAHKQLFDIYFKLGNLQKARECAIECSAHSPGQLFDLRGQGAIELAKGNLQKAKKYLEEVHNLTKGQAEGMDFDWNIELAYAYTLRKLRDPQAYELIQDLRKRFQKLGLRKDDPEYYLMLCALDAVEGKNDSALNNLQLAAAYNWLDYSGAQANPIFSDLRTNPRFFEIIQTVQTKVDRMRREIELMEGDGEMRI
jgi:tetratricopeptide (TPR) repeat protein